MSRENVELVREVYRGWARGDFRAGADVLSSDFEWAQLRNAVEPGSHRGADIGRAVRRVFEVYENFRVEADEYIDAGDEVVVVARSLGTARASGMQLDQRFAYVWTVRDGELVRSQMYPDRREALEAVGLAE